MYVYADYSPDEWEIDEDQLEIQEVLGEGAFGVVCKGVLTSQDDNGLAGSSLVAVKVSLRSSLKEHDHTRLTHLLVFFSTAICSLVIYCHLLANMLSSEIDIQDIIPSICVCVVTQWRNALYWSRCEPGFCY